MAESPILTHTAPQVRRSGLQVRTINEPLPVAKNTGVVREEMFKILGEMAVQQCVEVNRKKRSMENYIFAFRNKCGKHLRFTLRQTTVGTTRIWRIA